MRLDARNTTSNAWRYNVYHAERMEIMQRVVWVDDETAQYSQYTGTIVGNTPELVTHQARRIEIYPDRELVIINPIADDVDTPAALEAVAV